MHNKIIGSIELPILPPPAGSIFLGLSAGRIASLVREGLDEAYAAFFKELGGGTTINHVVIDMVIAGIVSANQTANLSYDGGIVTQISVLDGKSEGSGLVYREQVGKSNWYRENTAKLLSPEMITQIGKTKNAVVLDFAAGAGVVSIHLLERLADQGLKLDTLILMDIQPAYKHLLNAIDGIKPFLKSEVLRELKVYTLNKDAKRVIQGETRFAVPTQLPGIIDFTGKGTIDFIVAANCFHLMRDDLGLIFESLARVTKPGGKIMVNSTNIRPNETPSNSYYLEDIFVKLREKLILMANEPTSKYHSLKYLFEFHQKNNPHMISILIDQGIPPGPDLEEVLALFPGINDAIKVHTSVTTLTEADGRSFYRGMHRGYDRIMVPEAFRTLADSWLVSLGLTP